MIAEHASKRSGRIDLSAYVHQIQTEGRYLFLDKPRRWNAKLISAVFARYLSPISSSRLPGGTSSDQNPRSALGARQRKSPHDWIALRYARPKGDTMGTVGPRRHFLGLGELGTPWPGWAATGRPVRPVLFFSPLTYFVLSYLYTPGSISPVCVWLFSSSPLSTRGRYTQFAGRRLFLFQLLYLHSAYSPLSDSIAPSLPRRFHHQS